MKISSCAKSLFASLCIFGEKLTRGNKTFILFLLFVAVLPVKADSPVLHKPTLKVLDIGNSYTIDATALLSLIARNSGSDLSSICLYRCFRSSGSYKLWYDIYNDTDSLNTYTISKVFGGLATNAPTGTGAVNDGSLFRRVLTEENWDIVIIHQASAYAPYYELWNQEDNPGGSLDQLLSVIRTHQPEAQIGFLLVHSYWSGYSQNKEHSALERWQKIADATRQFCDDYDVDFVIPYGTAIQNLRASSWNNEYDLTRDGMHCCVGLAQYTAACCYYESLIAPRSGISVLGNKARYDASAASFEYPSIDVTDENALVAQEAAVLATQDWYHCQNPEDFIFTLTYEIDGEVYKSYDLVSGMMIEPEPSPEKDGFVFSGWSEIPEAMPDHDVTIKGTFMDPVNIKDVTSEEKNVLYYDISGRPVRYGQKGLFVVRQGTKTKKMFR